MRVMYQLILIALFHLVTIKTGRRHTIEKKLLYQPSKEKHMRVLAIINSKATQDGDGVKISRIADFTGKSFDPFLMFDELKSDDKNDFMGGFPAHPHRGIETFTYMLKGGFEHQDQLGNKKEITAGNVQWMSTGYGVVHSEMPIVDEQQSMHGFQIWLNMPAKDKLRPARYQDSTHLPILENSSGARLKLLAGTWEFSGVRRSSPLMGLSGNGAIADVMLESHGEAMFSSLGAQQILLYVHTGEITRPLLSAGQMAIIEPQQTLTMVASEQGAGALIFMGNKINQKIVHMGPFVMNTEQEIKDAINDYRNGKFGQLKA